MCHSEKASSVFTQEKLSKLANRVSQNMGRPVARFVRDILFGICGTGTASIFNIAKHTKDQDQHQKDQREILPEHG